MRRLRLRDLTDEERTTVERLAHSRTAPARRVERARIIWRAGQGHDVAEIADQLLLRAYVVRGWIHRFNAEGLSGLEDRSRSGRPPAYSPEQVATVIATALTDPKALGLPFASWTLDRLAAHLNEHQGIAVKRSRIDEIWTSPLGVEGSLTNPSTPGGMMAEKRTRRRFTAEFKARAVERLLEGGRGLSEVATELGLSPGQLSQWRNEHLAAGSAAALAARKAEQAELQRLRRENKRLEEEVEILRKAAAFFARGIA